MHEDTDGHTISPVNGGAVSSAVLTALEPYFDVIADRIAARLMKGRESMVSQAQSELGPRRHRAAVKRRLENGEGGAAVSPDGRRFLLTREAMFEELARKPPAASRAAAAEASPAGKTRKRELSDFEQRVMSGLRAVK